MTFDTNSDKIIVIHYPSGGFGNFLFHVLTEFAKETVKIDNYKFDFSQTGNSHATKKYTKVFFHNPDQYYPLISTKVEINNNYILVLSDAGTGKAGENLQKVKSTFPNSQIIKVLLNNLSKVVLYKAIQTKIKKCQWGNGEEIHQHHIENFNEIITDFEIREHYTMIYHEWDIAWTTPEPGIFNLDYEGLIVDPYSTLCDLINHLGLTVINHNQLINLCTKWKESNQHIFEIYFVWQKINSALDQKQNIQIDKSLNLHDQGYINYCIEKKFNVIIPVYDYRYWFDTTADIKKMIECLKSKT